MADGFTFDSPLIDLNMILHTAGEVLLLTYMPVNTVFNYLMVFQFEGTTGRDKPVFGKGEKSDEKQQYGDW